MPPGDRGAVRGGASGRKDPLACHPTTQAAHDGLYKTRMTALTITVVRQDGEPVAGGLRAEFGPQGGTIGRASGSTLLLPDPYRLISRTHAVVEMAEGAFIVRDQGSASPVVVNGQALGNGQFAPIRPGDELMIGRYSLRVDATMPFSAARTVASVAPASETRRADADSTPAAALGISMSGTMLSWSENGVPGAADVIRTVIIPSPVHAQPGLELEPEAGPLAEPVPSTAAIAAPTPQRAESPPIAVAPAGPAAATPARLPSLPPATEVPVAAPASNADLLQAFLAGAGVPRLAIPGGLTPEFMQAVGEMLRETIRGLLDLLTARALAKREVRADATVIVAHDNNPLKFSPSVEAAIDHLLTPRGTGFMPPLRAVTDAHDSLRSHQLAFMAGMQAALAAVLKRLDPTALEQRSGQPSFVGSFMPATHKARLWDQYTELHAAILRDADADCQSLFGREFLGAYQSQVSRLRAQTEQRSGS